MKIVLMPCSVDLILVATPYSVDVDGAQHLTMAGHPKMQKSPMSAFELWKS